MSWIVIWGGAGVGCAKAFQERSDVGRPGVIGGESSGHPGEKEEGLSA